MTEKTGDKDRDKPRSKDEMSKSQLLKDQLQYVFPPLLKPLTRKQAVILTNVNQNFKLRNLVSLHKKTQVFCNHKTLFLYLANPHTCTLVFLHSQIPKLNSTLFLHPSPDLQPLQKCRSA